MPDQDDTDEVDIEDHVDTYEAATGELPPSRWKKGDPIPHLSLRQLIDFENEHPGHAGGKEAHIGTTFGIRPVNYYQQLNQALDNPEALAIDPILIHRLRTRRHNLVTTRLNYRIPRNR